eukprot:6857303-Prymnesium_polylepis.1
MANVSDGPASASPLGMASAWASISTSRTPLALGRWPAVPTQPPPTTAHGPWLLDPIGSRQFAPSAPPHNGCGGASYAPQDKSRSKHEVVAAAA